MKRLKKNPPVFKVLLLLLCLPASLWASELKQTPQQVVEQFYGTLLQTMTAPFPDQLKVVAGMLSGELNALIREARSAEAEYLGLYPDDKGPLGDGACFFYGGGDCTFTSFSILQSNIQGKSASVTAMLGLVDERPGYPSTSWENLVTLVQDQDGWVITDIRYFGTHASAVLKESGCA